TFDLDEYAFAALKAGASGVSRVPAAGASSGAASSWLRRSGDALTRYQATPSALTARQSWLRAAPVRRAVEQPSQPQFHWGSPPPAAVPRIRIFSASSGARGPGWPPGPAR
ncbi:hypothetical protein ACFVXQ_35310, partial [Kitasatospora sp. NPDC058263]